MPDVLYELWAEIICLYFYMLKFQNPGTQTLETRVMNGHVSSREFMKYVLIFANLYIRPTCY